VPFFYGLFFKEKQPVPNDLATGLALLKTNTTDSSKKYQSRRFDEVDRYDDFYPAKKTAENNFHNAVLFYFDPNNLPATGWKKLGLKDKTISSIQKYLSKGGRFRQPEDLKKIWGLNQNLVQRLLPYVKIEAVNNSFQSRPEYESKKYEAKKMPALMDINHADSISLDGLPGIGPALSRRILGFRDRLGGFYSVDQVSETFGLPDSVFKKIKDRLVLNDPMLRQININTATADEMKQHPYIRYQLANAIVQFREQHGLFSHIGDIKKIMMLNDEIYNKLAPYLTVQ
jgi:competence ComEA-like helix-hairpin-helix protein